MKFTKHILAVFLALVLTLGLALPAMAAVNWDAFMFTQRPKDITIKYGDSFTLSAEVRVPEGAEVEYQWYYFSGRSVLIENATTKELHLDPDSPFYPQNERLGGASANYICGVTAHEIDDANNTRQVSASAYVTIERTALGKLYDLTIAPFVYAFGGTVGLISMTMGIALPVSPVAFIFFLIYGFIEGFIGLFR